MPTRLGAAAVLSLGAWVATRMGSSMPAFVAGPSATALRRSPNLVQRRAEEVEDVVDLAAPEDEEEDERAFPDEAYMDYEWDEKPDQAWFDRNKINRNKVNMMFFKKFAKPVDFFPHKMQPGDTVRITYLMPDPKGDKEVRSYQSYDPKALRSVKFDGILLGIRGAYHARTLTVRAMVGKSPDIMGVEMSFPMFSPLVKRIQVLRRGYIGRAKNAYFMRAMVGRKNVIPIDKERTEMDKIYNQLRAEGRADEIPESTYPTNEWERYPLPRWVQDEDDWDEEKYNPDDVDQRTDYEIRVIGRFKARISPSGKYGHR